MQARGSETQRRSMAFQGFVRRLGHALVCWLVLGCPARRADAQPWRVPEPVVEAIRLASEGGGARLDRTACGKTYGSNPLSECYVQPFGRAGGAAEILSDPPGARDIERLVLELRSGISVPAQNALLYEPNTRRLFVHDGLSIRVFHFDRLVWEFVTACRVPVVAPDQASIACLGTRGELVRVPVSTDDAPSTVFVPEQPATLVNRHREWLEQHPPRFSERDGSTFVTVSLPREVPECTGPLERAGSVSCFRVGGPSRRYTVAWDVTANGGPETSGDSVVAAARAAFAHGRMESETRRVPAVGCRDVVGMEMDGVCDVTRARHAEAVVVELCPDGVAWSPMCQRLRRRGWWVRDNQGRARQVDVAPDVGLAAVTDDGRTAIAFSHDGTWAYDLDEGTFEFVGPCWNPTLSTDGVWLACGDLGGGVRLSALRDLETQVVVGASSLRAGQALAMAPTDEPLGLEITDGCPAFLVPSRPYDGASGALHGVDYVDRWFRSTSAERVRVALDCSP